ncbi:MAG: ABC transporter ATP-binding protein [Bacilli bacterium]|nr:ABC transporter ATP-binding protein [Bacilli bacterium]
MNALNVKNISINYKDITKFSIKRSLFKRRKSKTFKALDDVSFSVKKGEILGIVGQNGSGKSTLLKAIAGVFSPDEGFIDLKDNSVSLLSIGVGFNKKLTGLENIYLSGMLLGFSEKEIKEKEKEIIEFADIGDFIYKPVKTYSSGMYSKLAFAITSTLETDIILIDEVLSVGDINFKKKSYNKMKELISDKNRTVIIISHNLNSIKELCDRVLWLHSGKVKKIGSPEEVVKEYTEFMNKN